MEPWMTSPKTSLEFRRQHKIWREATSSRDDRITAIDKMVKVAVTWEELLELLSITIEDKQGKIVLEEIKKLAGNDFEMWFDAFRMASIGGKKEEQKITFERMRKTKGSFSQWQKVRGWSTHKTKYGKAAFEEMKSSANNLTEICKVWRVMLGLGG